jgi:hypothetical protein
VTTGFFRLTGSGLEEPCVAFKASLKLCCDKS